MPLKISPLKFYSQEQRREGMRQLVLLHLHKLGGHATARELAGSIGKALKHVWPRITELKDAERIRDTGLRVRSGRGRPTVVWSSPDMTPLNDRLAFETEADYTAAKTTDEPSWFKNFGT